MNLLINDLLDKDIISEKLDINNIADPEITA